MAATVLDADWLLAVLGYVLANPAQRDYYGDALITYRDGKESVYQYPRMYTLPIPEKYVQERYRKFYERAHLEASSYVWKVFAQRIAREVNRQEGNPPVLVMLRRHWRDVAPPGKEQKQTYESYIYYHYQVMPEDLKG